MGKGKKSSGVSKASKGERKSSISTRLNDPLARALNQQKALAKGKRIVVTVPNPNTAQTNKPFVRVAYDHKNIKGVVIS